MKGIPDTGMNDGHHVFSRAYRALSIWAVPVEALWSVVVIRSYFNLFKTRGVGALHHVPEVTP